MVGNRGTGKDGEPAPERSFVVKDAHVAHRAEEGFLEEVVEVAGLSVPSARKVTEQPQPGALIEGGPSRFIALHQGGGEEREFRIRSSVDQ